MSCIKEWLCERRPSPVGVDAGAAPPSDPALARERAPHGVGDVRPALDRPLHVVRPGAPLAEDRRPARGWRSGGTRSLWPGAAAPASPGVSASTSPETSGSPRPRVALITISSRLCVIGLRVNAIADASAGTRGCTSTAMPAPANGSPRAARYATARRDNSEAQHSRTASSTASGRTPSLVACWPANDASRVSSATADDRTASSRCGAPPSRSRASWSPLASSPGRGLAP
jgi:hypothetical protein